MKSGNILVALAGQPNCGKSTVFNAVTGASQHVANYPGVTVDKKTGWLRYNGSRFEVVDLPGTYSLTSYSPEERVARDFILHEKPAVVVNVTDASNLKRSLYLSFQLMEMEIPLILELNMMDVAEKRGVEIDVKNLEQRLGVKAVPTSMKNGKGKAELLLAIEGVAFQNDKRQSVRIDYGALEPYIKDVEDQLFQDTTIGTQYPLRWFALKLLEGDEAVSGLVQERHSRAEEFLSYVETLRSKFEERHAAAPEVHIAQRRYQAAEDIARTSIINLDPDKRTLTDKVDGVVCHRFAGPVILVGVIWLLYYLAIVQGYNLTNYTWPLLAKLRSLAESLTPAPGFIEIPLLRAFSLWFIDSINALLNYVPIFFILFALISILEDSGYMPRMAFIMDRLFGRFGLHGQSTLPMVLGGIYVGGCAVPGVMSCKGIPDERSRLATILIIPLLNCLAKVPLYVLLINIYFAAHKAWAMFFISTISLLMVLPVSKLLTLTVLKDKETAPFVMEMPPYHLPSVRGVLGRAIERVWLFIRKITTIVAAVAVVIFVLLQFPGLSAERMAYYEDGKDKAIAKFYKKIVKFPEHHTVLQGGSLMEMVNYWEEYKSAKMMTQGEEAMAALQGKFKSRNEDFFRIAQPQSKDDKKVNREFKKLVKARNKLLREMKKERIDNSFLGKLGKSLTPVTRYAGFDWKVNVALLSALAAKESSVATLGALYQPDESGQENQTLEQRMEGDSEGFTPLHALALMLFMVLYPPCLATTIAVKVQTGSVKWMLFSMVYPMFLGLSVAVLVFSGGTALGLTGLQAMWAFYGLALAITIAMGFVKNKTQYV
ncbi:ferrous iron transport protein B [Desulfatibacillum aliphaticivorans]|uniref:ferrous iron transport protein B n=1 Tax=Desulfatibacillum aliphaticivorans TaxID=218208 RepID=UPI0003FDF47A|nr:ferrous iron transport protein B [Desulfatibacillum aliphaticivorans]